MSIEQEALDFIQHLQILYFENRDFDTLLSNLDNSISWIGTGNEEICNNIEEAKAAFLAEKFDYNCKYHISKSELTAQAVSRNTCFVYGKILAESKDPHFADENNRISAICVKSNGQMKLTHLHLSTSDEYLGPGEIHAKKSSILSKEKLKKMVKKTTADLSKRNAELEEFTSNVPGGMHRCLNDKYFTMLSISDSFLSLFGYTREELKTLFNNRFIEIIVPEDRETVLKSMEEQFKTQNSCEIEYRARHKNGSILWILDKGVLKANSNGTNTVYCVMLDITSYREKSEALRLSLERHEIIMDQASDIIFEWDIDKDFIIYSKNWYKKFGYEPINKDASKKIPFSNHLHPDDLKNFSNLIKKLLSGSSYEETEFRILSGPEKYIWCRVRATLQFDSFNKPVKAVGVIVDVDNEKSQHQQLIALAQQDSLTGLLNKASTKVYIDKYLSSAVNTNGCLMIIDLDSFKTINDKYGHFCGDTVLIDVADALKSIFSSQDIIGRIGGDEFLVFIKNSDIRSIEKKAYALISVIENISIKGASNSISCSIGAAFSPKDGSEFCSLYPLADYALYHVKNNGKRGYMAYNQTLDKDNTSKEIINSSVSSSIDSELANEKLEKYCFHTLYNSKDVKAAVNHILKILGNAFNVSRVYIFEDYIDGKLSSNTFEWCNNGIPSTKEDFQNFSYEERGIFNYYENFNENGIFYCPNVEVLDKKYYDMFKAQDINSVLQCMICDDGKPIGFIGFDNCKYNRNWTDKQINALSLVSNILSTFLIKERLKERLAELNKRI